MPSRCIGPAADRQPGRCPHAAEPGSVFCRTCELAPAAQRGGWVSAERRRRKLAASEQALDASNIMPRLWVGSQPPHDRDLPDFDVVALCAAELQPERVAFHGLMIRCPLPDDALDNAQLTRALITARAIARSLTGGRRVLVTCAGGMNRSALVAGLSLARLTRMSGDDIIQLIRSRRHPNALFNHHFQDILRRIAGPGRAPYR